MTDPIVEYKEGEAHENYTRIIQAKKIVGLGAMSMGRELLECHDNKHWQELEYNSFPEFLASPEINISKGWASKLINTYRVWKVELEVAEERLAEIDVEALYLTTKVVNQANKEQWLENAKSLSRSDLKAELVDDKAGETHDCWEDTVYELLTKCAVCGKVVRREKKDVS